MTNKLQSEVLETPQTNLFDFRMNDGSRNFADLPETVFFDKIREHLAGLDGAEETGFISDSVTEMWLDFNYSGYRFTINNQNSNYWFFVDDPKCTDAILQAVIDHFKTLLN